MKATYSRASPSPRYRRLIEQYRLMHTQGEIHLGIPPERTFPGQSLPPQAPNIKRLIKATGARTLLDYGCGKGQQSLQLAQRFGFSVTGIDPVPLHIEMSNEALREAAAEQPEPGVPPPPAWVAAVTVFDTAD